MDVDVKCRGGVESVCLSILSCLLGLLQSLTLMPATCFAVCNPAKTYTCMIIFIAVPGFVAFFSLHLLLPFLPLLSLLYCFFPFVSPPKSCPYPKVLLPPPFFSGSVPVANHPTPHSYTLR